MKRHIVYTLLVSVLLPSLLTALFVRLANNNRGELEPTQPPDIMQTEKPGGDGAGNTVRLATEKGIEVMNLEDYVVCVVLGEMPADFELEALKAQAVVVRTYTRKSQQNSKHPQADVCTDSACCQAFRTGTEYLSAGGTEEMLTKVRQAVYSTEGQVLTYDSELIEATYFSCSGGKTEDAKAVWGSDVPYLQSVESPGEEQATHFTDTVKFSAPEFCQKLGLQHSLEKPLSVEKISYTDGGGVSEIVINGRSYSGTEIRKMLNLRSTAFVITAMGNSVTITTKGFGHRVGMSQYGAEAMALQGKSYREILSHYYRGAVLSG